MKEKLEQYSFIAQIVSALAVVASLIFVGIGIRQNTEQAVLNTRAIEVTAYQDLIGQAMVINSDLMSNPALVAIIDKTQTGQELDAQENIIASRYIFNIARHVDMSCYQYRQGLVTADMLASILGPFRVATRLLIPNLTDATNDGVIQILLGIPDLVECLEPFIPGVEDYLQSYRSDPGAIDAFPAR